MWSEFNELSKGSPKRTSQCNQNFLGLKDAIAVYTYTCCTAVLKTCLCQICFCFVLFVNGSCGLIFMLWALFVKFCTLPVSMHDIAIE